MRFPFDERKTAHAAAYLLRKHGNQLNYMKLIKLLYLADRQSLLEFGKPITGDRMVAMPKGPVLAGVLDLINWGKRRNESCVWFDLVSEPIGYDVKLAAEITLEDLDRLSEDECRILDEVFEEYGQIDKWSLVDLTHRLPEWSDPHGSSFPIDPADILRAEGRSEQEIHRIARNAERAMYLRSLDAMEIELD
jgi:uncharacterized phage-associated protein